MRRYLIRVPKYFGSQLDIEVEAMDETDAITIAKEYIKTMAGRENLIQEWITCVGEVVDDSVGSKKGERYENLGIDRI